MEAEQFVENAQRSEIVIIDVDPKGCIRTGIHIVRNGDTKHFDVDTYVGPDPADMTFADYMLYLRALCSIPRFQEVIVHHIGIWLTGKWDPKNDRDPERD